MDMDTRENEQMNTGQQAETDRRQRVGRITRNFFLHIHATRVHVHSMKPTYTFGLGMILGFLFLVMVFTGVILMIYYTPSVETAYQSVKDIIYVVPGGRIIRNMHRWASQGMVIVAFLHLIRVFYTGSYLGNRSLNWVIGVVLYHEPGYWIITGIEILNRDANQQPFVRGQCSNPRVIAGCDIRQNLSFTKGQYIDHLPTLRAAVDIEFQEQELGSIQRFGPHGKRSP